MRTRTVKIPNKSCDLRALLSACPNLFEGNPQSVVCKRCMYANVCAYSLFYQGGCPIMKALGEPVLDFLCGLLRPKRIKGFFVLGHRP